MSTVSMGLMSVQNYIFDGKFILAISEDLPTCRAENLYEIAYGMIDISQGRKGN